MPSLRDFYKHPRGLVVFDLDHTLIQGNASFFFGKFLCKVGFLRYPKMLLLCGAYCLYQVGMISLERLHRTCFALLFQGADAGVLAQYAEQFTEKVVPDLIHRKIQDALLRAQEMGSEVWIMSSSPECVVRPIARMLGVSDVYATAYETDTKGCFCSVRDIVCGAKKVRKIKSVLQELKLSQADLACYSDSCEDLEVLKMAGHAVAVNPDRIVRQVALKNGWQIVCG